MSIKAAAVIVLQNLSLLSQAQYSVLSDGSKNVFSPDGILSVLSFDIFDTA